MKNLGESIDFAVFQVDNFKSPYKATFSLPQGQEKTIYVFHHELQAFEMTLTTYELVHSAWKRPEALIFWPLHSLNHWSINQRCISTFQLSYFLFWIK